MIKVFLVEDEIVIRNGIHRMIPWTEYGYEFVGEAGDGEMALPLIRKIKPDVIITDIKMPFLDGLALSKLVKKELPETKIVIVSGYDDFEYAQQAISLGVERYLLKPISKNNFIEVLNEIRMKYEHENAQKIYYEKFKNEIQEYEQYSRREFFEALISGHVSIQTVYEKAEKLQMDITAPCYNIVLFTMDSIEKKQIFHSTYSQKIAELQNHLDQLFCNMPDCILFRNQIFSYAVLVKGEKMQIEQQVEKCVHELQNFFSQGGEQIDWFICTGKIVERLSLLSESYQDAMHTFTSRYINKYKVNEMNLKNLDISAINPEIILNFLSNALSDEVNDFVGNYFQMIGEDALESSIFRQYILLNIHFSTVSFIQSLGFQKEELDCYLPLVCLNDTSSVESVSLVVQKILTKGIQLREESTKSRYKGVLEVATEFINKNFMDDTLSLNKVACSANVSANHFSALFSREMNKTFIEYLTELRMNKAKQLLRCTDMRSGEIALEVGYKDSHYFSFIFKKTQGCTPSDYRNGKGGGV
ncbi:response regulator transcription factor [Anaeromicropila populeti]|uniref:Stage 0 sporulation protein A homolog n=1 Tax=Anaeromicropila populeti TaxID=37658 RepID=A0A1I6LLP1_9FIRM|nr:response regulator [Anaeromicropila populeti]SFS04405.1 two-component system, response regulator YesN [Anaeromicropila populeti]